MTGMLFFCTYLLLEKGKICTFVLDKRLIRDENETENA